ncbi:unnamed protein product [Protopolystoma xenopodis]|uniref:Uncharacterized protein n=1 Tax=Protopolystoma xenopodis TaxID=117903 RepID=A0A448X7X6_9PLAT|nr:unnamed protein product [Protopolystoma xenopodis]
MNPLGALGVDETSDAVSAAVVRLADKARQAVSLSSPTKRSNTSVPEPCRISRNETSRRKEETGYAKEAEGREEEEDEDAVEVGESDEESSAESSDSTKDWLFTELPGQLKLSAQVLF